MYSLFHKTSKTDDLPLLLLKFLINDNEVERVESIKFLGVLLHEHISWKKTFKKHRKQKWLKYCFIV